MFPSKVRFQVGACVLVVSFCAPALIPVVAVTNFSTEVKTALSGLLLAGIPEIGMLAAIAIMGKEGFVRFKAAIGQLLAPIAPPERVSAARYNIGLAMFIAPLALAWTAPYLGQYLPGYQQHPLLYATIGDVIFLSSLFILGGEFWDKLRALFDHEARIVTFVPPTDTENKYRHRTSKFG